MSKIPPLLPSETLRRVLRVARVNGTSVLFFAGLFALSTAAGQDRLGTFVALLVSGAGGMELHGASLLSVADGRGLRWLVGSQLFLMAVVFAYVGFRLNHVDLGLITSLFPADILHQVAQQAGQSDQEFKSQLYERIQFGLAVATLIYQGWMIFYYSRRRQAVFTALAQES